MKMENIGLLCGITNRTKAYLLNMGNNQLFPNSALIMSPKEKMPGQSGSDSSHHGKKLDRPDPHAYFDSNIDIFDFLQRHNIEHHIIPTDDVNDPRVISYLSRRPEEVYLYSGFGGAILRSRILNIGKKFLHVHPGKIPDHKGSTTIYFSILCEKKCYASAIFLAEKLDSGPLIKTKSFPMPKDGESIDYQYEPFIRSELLVEVLKDYIKYGEFKTRTVAEKGETYYIIHPVLKHISILVNNHLAGKN